MKGIKKVVLSVVLALVLAMGSAVCAMAAWDGVPAKDQTAINAVNGGNASGLTFKNTTGFDLGGRDFITKFVDVRPKSEGTASPSKTTGVHYVAKNAQGKYTVTLTGGTGYTDIAMVHYSTVKQKWEMQAGNTVTWDDLSPLALVGKKTNALAGTATSPKTGMDRSWTLWLGAACGFACAAVLVRMWKSEK